MHMDDSVNDLTYFLVWPLPETAMSLPCNCLVGTSPYIHTIIGDTILPFVRKSTVSPHENDLTRPPAVKTAKKKKENKKNGALVVYQ